MVAKDYDSSRLNWRERRAEIRRIIEEMGLWNISKTAMAKKFNVSEGLIRHDIKQIIKKIPASELEEPCFEFFKAYKKAQKELRKIMLTGETKEKIQAIKELTNLGEKFTRLLEDYGLKEKIAEKLEIENRPNVLTYDDIRKVIKEKNGESNQRNNK